MKYYIPFAFTLLLISCKSHKLLGTIPCYGTTDADSIYTEIFYNYRFLKEVAIENIAAQEIERLDSLFTFTNTISGHEGWGVNDGKKYNDFYHPENFVVENPNEFEGKPRYDYSFSLYCPNEMSERIRLFIDNDFNKEIDKLSVSIKPYKYFYNKKKKTFQPLVRIVSIDTLFYADTLALGK